MPLCLKVLSVVANELIEMTDDTTLTVFFIKRWTDLSKRGWTIKWAKDCAMLNPWAEEMWAIQRKFFGAHKSSRWKSWCK